MKQKNNTHSLHHPLFDKVTSTIEKNRLLESGNTVIVGVSGGADSLALLNILQGINMQLRPVAVYVDHGLRPTEVPLEIETIDVCCQSLRVPFIVQSIDVLSFAEKQKRSIEDSARILRYEIFQKLRILHSADVIAVGHNADDQVEEFLLKAIRGSSRKSFSGMELQNGHIIRPLLQIRKSELIAFLESKGVPWCLDSSNLKRDYLRNRIRLDLLPLLQREFNPSINKTILQNMDILREEERFLENNTIEAYEDCTSSSPGACNNASRERLTIRTELFLSYHPAIRRRILEKCCWKMETKPSYEQICALMELVNYGSTGGEIHLSSGLRAEKTVDSLFFSRPLPSGETRGSVEAAQLAAKSIPSPGIYYFKELNKELILEKVPIALCREKEQRVLCIDFETIVFPLLCRSSQPGERFHPLGAPGSKKVSRFFNEKKIPARSRPSYPVLLTDDRVAALPGLQIDDRHKITEATTTALRICWKNVD